MIPIPPQAPARQPPVLPSGGETPIIPSGVSPAMGGEDTEKDLERIRKEILDKLTPEQKAQAEADLEKEKAEAGGDKIPQPVSNDLNLETNSGVKYGNTTFNMTAPVGFYDLFRRYRQFIENLQFNTIKIKEGYFNIPENKYVGLENQRINILKAFNTFNSGLNANQVQYIDNNPTLSEIEKLLDNTLLEDLEDILKQELQKQKVNIIEISGGKKPSSLEAEEKANEEFEELLNSTKDKTTELKAQIKNTSDSVLLKSIISTLNNKLKVNIDNEFNKLSGEEKTASLTSYNNLKATINDLVTKTQQKITEIESKEEPVEPKPVEPKPIEPVEPVSPVSPVNPIDDAGVRPAPILPQPRARPRPRRPQPLSKDQKLLVEYVMNVSKNYAGPQRDAIEKLFSREQAVDLREKIKDAKVRKQKVKELLLDSGVDPIYFN